MTITDTAMRPAEVDVNLDDVDTIRNPFPVLEQVRTAGTIAYNTNQPQGYLVTGFKAVQRVIGDVVKFRQSQDFYIERFGGMVFEADDTPRHDRIRAVFADRFQRESLDQHMHRTITSIIDDCMTDTIERVRSGEDINVARTLTRRVPEMVIIDLLGIARDDHDEFMECAELMTTWREGMADPSPRGREIVERSNAATKRLNELIEGEIRRRRESGPGGDDLISRIVFSEVAEKEMSYQEVVANCSHFVFAGGDTTSKLLGHMLVLLAEHPDQRRLLIEEPGLRRQAIEEMVRFTSPAQTGAPRTVAESGIVLDGYELEEGTPIIPLIAAANRDPSRWDAPERFDVRREPQRHLAFGFGMHACLGLNLARLEATIMLDMLLERIPDWQVSGVDYGRNANVRGPIALSLTL